MGVPSLVAAELHQSLWYVLMAPTLCQEVKIYEQWMSGGERRRLSKVANSVEALLGAERGVVVLLRDGAGPLHSVVRYWGKRNEEVLVLMKERYSFQSLPSVKFLRLHTASPNEFGGLVQLFYNLEDIAIDWTFGDMWTSFHDYTLPPRPLEDGYRYEYLEGDLHVIRNCISRLKTIRLDWHFSDDAQPRLVRFLLKNCKELSKVDIVNVRKGLEDYDEDVADMLAAMWDIARMWVHCLLNKHERLLNKFVRM